MTGQAPVIDRYSTWEMDAMIETIDPQFSFLHSTFFSSEKQFNTSTVEHDIREGGRRVAPFVSPLQQGRASRRNGYRTYAMRPAYVKLKDTVRPQDGLTRLPGEPYGGNLDPMARIDRLVAEQIGTHFEMIDNRLEIMASDALFNGKVTVSGPDYPTAVVDFERNPLNVAQSATPWSSSSSTPLADIQAHALTINQTSRGAVVNTLLMTGTIFDMMTRNQDVRQLVNIMSNLSPGTKGIEFGPRSGEREARYRGTLSGKYDLWTYDGYVEDDTGSNFEIMPQDRVLFLANQGPNSGMQGQRLQGAIQDMAAGLKSQRVFVKAHDVWDPSGIEVLTQSAPMLSIRRPNATGTLKVN